MLTVDPQILQLLLDLVRDQAKILGAVATGVAVNADRIAAISECSTQSREVLARLDAFLMSQQSANALVRAQSDAGRVEERVALARLYDTVTKGLKSGTGQRVIQTVVLALVGWATLHGYVPMPGAAP